MRTKKSKFPETINVTIDIDPNAAPEDRENLLAYRSIEGGAVGDDGATDVALYRLLKVRRFRKKIVEEE